jgi:hypothetical protein
MPAVVWGQPPERLHGVRRTPSRPPDPGDEIAPTGGLQDVLVGNGRDMSSTSEKVERERKFEAAEDVSLSDVPGASVIDPSGERLTATFWDTAHRRLLRWGHLRHRRASEGLLTPP